MLQSLRQLFPFMALFQQTLASINQNSCPLMGPVFPAIDHIEIEIFQAYADKFTTALEQSLNTASNKLGDWNSVSSTFAISTYSATSNTSLYEHFYEGTEIKGNVTGGKFNNDTQFRIGSITKVFTVYAYLATVGERHLEDPITKWLPELAAIDATNAQETSSNPIDTTQWSDVTLRALASQLSGIVRDYGLGDYAGMFKTDEETDAMGLPKLHTVSKPVCAPLTEGFSSCSRSEFFQGLSSVSPVYKPYHGALYSNINYGLLAFALEAIMDGKTFDQILTDKILAPLHLERTSYTLPSPGSKTPENAALPYNYTFSGFDDDAGSDAAAGAIWSTLADMDNFGRAILRSTLLPQHITNMWLKPVVQVSDPMQAVGAPWEIFRMEVHVSPGSTATRLVEYYTKSGDVGLYATMMILIPDYNVGMTLMVAGGISRSFMRAKIADLWVKHMIPAFEDLARQNAQILYTGLYEDSTTNSSIEIGLDADQTGLGIRKWTSRGIDMLAGPIQTLYGSLSPGKVPSMRLQPSGLVDETRVGFRLVVDNYSDAFRGTFMECFTWVAPSGAQYGGYGLDDFVIERKSVHGKGIMVDARAFRTKMKRANLRSDTHGLFSGSCG